LKPTQIVEAVLFASDAPLKAEEIARADESLDEDAVEAAIRDLRAEYAESGRAFQIEEVAEGYQILTLSEFAPYLERFDTVPRPSRLSGPSLETLAIIAYRQPIGRLEIEYIRGVSSAGVIRTLQDRALIDIVGRAEGVGRPLLYGTTSRFLEHFGFKSLDALPTPEELPVVLRERTPLGIDLDDDGPTESALERQGQVAMPLGALEQEAAGTADAADAAREDLDAATHADEDSVTDEHEPALAEAQVSTVPSEAMGSAVEESGDA
jgi:segregation and condensation protein B